MEYDFILMVAFGQFGSEQVLVTVFGSNFESPEMNLSFSLPKTSIFPLTTCGTTLKVSNHFIFASPNSASMRNLFISEKVAGSWGIWKQIDIRQLTDWARKEREQRLKILFALHPLDEDLGRESNFGKKKNLKYQLSKLQEKYPIVSKADAHSSQAKFTINTKLDGDAFCTYHSDLTTILKEAEDINKNCKTLLASCLKGQSLNTFLQKYTLSMKMSAKNLKPF